MSVQQKDIENDIKDGILSSKTLKKIFGNPFIAALVATASIAVILILIFQCESNLTSFNNKIFKFLFYCFLCISCIFMINFTITEEESKKKTRVVTGSGSSKVTLNPIFPRNGDSLNQSSTPSVNNPIFRPQPVPQVPPQVPPHVPPQVPPQVPPPVPPQVPPPVPQQRKLNVDFSKGSDEQVPITVVGESIN